MHKTTYRNMVLNMLIMILKSNVFIMRALGIKQAETFREYVEHREAEKEMLLND